MSSILKKKCNREYNRGSERTRGLREGAGLASRGGRRLREEREKSLHAFPLSLFHLFPLLVLLFPSFAPQLLRPPRLNKDQSNQILSLRLSFSLSVSLALQSEEKKKEKTEKNRDPLSLSLLRAPPPSLPPGKKKKSLKKNFSIKPCRGSAAAPRTARASCSPPPGTRPTSGPRPRRRSSRRPARREGSAGTTPAGRPASSDPR